MAWPVVGVARKALAARGSGLTGPEAGYDQGDTPYGSGQHPSGILSPRREMLPRWQLPGWPARRERAMTAAYDMPAVAVEVPADHGGAPAATVPGTVTGSLLLVGLLVLVAGAWGGIVAYVGPIFGFGATGTASWTWNLAHGLLALAPGAVAVAAGLVVLADAGRNALGLGRRGLALAGIGALASGAWFVVGPAAWPVVEHGASYFAAASPTRQLLNSIGYSFGPGIVLAACGGFTLAKALRHRVAPSTMSRNVAVAGAAPVAARHLRRLPDPPAATPMPSPQQPMARPHPRRSGPRLISAVRPGCGATPGRS